MKKFALWCSSEEESEAEWDSPGDEWKTGWGRQDTAAGYKSKRQKAGRKRFGSRRVGVRVRNAAVSALLAAVVLVSVGAVGFLILQISGKNSLYSRADSSSLVSALSEITVELGDDVQDDGTEDWQEGDINWSGKPVAVTFYFNSSLFDITSKYVFVHITEKGKTEVLPVTVSAYGEVTATFNSFSPVVLAYCFSVGVVRRG